MTWQKWDTSRLQVKGLVGFASVSISPNYGRPWTKQGRSFHHSDSWMVTCRCQCHELLKMIFSRKSNSSWHSFLTKRFCWNGNWGGGAKKPFPGTPAFVLLKVFCSFWLGALPVWMPRSPLGRAWNTSWCPGGLWAETLNPRGAVQLGSENLIVDRCCGIQVVIHSRSWERWRLVDKLVPMLCLFRCDASYHWFKRLLVLLLLVQDQRTPRRVQAGQLALMTLSQTGNGTTWATCMGWRWRGRFLVSMVYCVNWRKVYIWESQMDSEILTSI